MIVYSPFYDLFMCYTMDLHNFFTFIQRYTKRHNKNNTLVLKLPFICELSFYTQIPLVQQFTKNNIIINQEIIKVLRFNIYPLFVKCDAIHK